MERTVGKNFFLGRIVITPGIETSLSSQDTNEQWIVNCLARHLSGDWGVVDEHDRQVNNAAMMRGSRVLSRYPLRPTIVQVAPGHEMIPPPPPPTRHEVVPTKYFYIITEPSQERTTILLPDEY